MDAEFWTVPDTTIVTAFSRPPLSETRYPTRWKAFQKRLLTQDQRDILIKQGVRLMQPARDAVESPKPPDKKNTTPPPPVDWAARYEGESRAQVYFKGGTPFSGNVGGNYAAKLAALGYPCEWHRAEMRELPVSLFREMVSRGEDVTLDANIFEDGEIEKYKARHEQYVKAWREERAAKIAQASEQNRQTEMVQAVRAELQKEELAKREEILTRLGY